MLYDTIPLNHSDTSSLYQSYSRLRRHPDRGWLYSLTRDHQYSRAVHAAHHLLGTNLWVQMTIPLQTREEGRLAILRRASTRTLAGQTTPIPTTALEKMKKKYVTVLGPKIVVVALREHPQGLQGSHLNLS